MKKIKITAIILCTFMVLSSLAACGSGSNSPSLDSIKSKFKDAGAGYTTTSFSKSNIETSIIKFKNQESAEEYKQSRSSSDVKISTKNDVYVCRVFCPDASSKEAEMQAVIDLFESCFK